MAQTYLQMLMNPNYQLHIKLTFAHIHTH